MRLASSSSASASDSVGTKTIERGCAPMRRLALGRHISGNALLDRARLTDIEHLALCPDHAIDAGPERRVAPEFPDRLGATRNARRLNRRLGAGTVGGGGIG